ncbi:MAG: hypothetical protein JRG74_12380 [Deltaproteobacteria bacterium]|nr:hypothetical protein [Deltaproteobacteria bacterium]
MTALFNALMRGRQCPRIPVAALSTGSHLASFIKSSLASRASLQLPTFDVAQATGWTGSEQNKQVEQTAILLRLKQFKLSLSSWSVLGFQDFKSPLLTRTVKDICSLILLTTKIF